MGLSLGIAEIVQNNHYLIMRIQLFGCIRFGRQLFSLTFMISLIQHTTDCSLIDILEMQKIKMSCEIQL